MNGWLATTTAQLLADGVIEIGDGYRAKNAEFVEEGGLPFVRVSDVRTSVRLEGLDELPIDDAARYRPKISEPFDSLITMKGTVGRVAYVSQHDRPFVYSPQISYWRSRNSDRVLPRWLRYWLESPEFSAQALASKGATDMADYINLRDQRRMRITVPPLCVQHRVAEVLGTVDDLIASNCRRIELLEQMAQAIYGEWFVHFRYPGHEDAALVDSALGPIPEGWEVRQIVAIAGTARNSVTGGPFGSKLGRKDYVDGGVPVLRGANLRVGGGFDETDVVFVSEEKAAALRGSLARRGDVIVTQRGTLGQVGLIPPRSRFDQYLLSQSQMKITVDSAAATAEFIYAQFRTPETTGRFIAQAMSSGVPHVNLALLREFEVLLPPLAVQAAFIEALAPLSSQESSLREQNRVLMSIRDLLLPRLVTGEIDVSTLNLDALVHSVA